MGVAKDLKTAIQCSPLNSNPDNSNFCLIQSFLHRLNTFNLKGKT